MLHCIHINGAFYVIVIIKLGSNVLEHESSRCFCLGNCLGVLSRGGVRNQGSVIKKLSAVVTCCGSLTAVEHGRLFMEQVSCDTGMNASTVHIATCGFLIGHFFVSVIVSRHDLFYTLSNYDQIS